MWFEVIVYQSLVLNPQPRLDYAVGVDGMGLPLVGI
jgi:NADH:ubiquinone oxidoreductase subunit 4 (subunit M)